MNIAPASTSRVLIVKIVNDSGLPVLGLVAATFPPTFYTFTGAMPVSITLTDLPLVNSNYSSGGVFELGGGRYRLDVPDAAFATARDMVSIFGEASGKHLSIDQSAITVRYMQSDVRQWIGATPGTLAQERNSMAAVVIRRTMANVELSDGDDLDEASLYGMVQRASKSSAIAHANKHTIYQTDGVTELAQIPTADDAAANPITKMGAV